VKRLGAVGHAGEFIKEQFRHCKPILAIGAGRDLVENAGVFTRLPSGEPDPGLITVAADEVDSATLRFIEAIARHRHFERYADPPLV
jgi:hypothetical protein